jgi:CxxC-x17-CxxC domain-containing protein
MRNFNQDNRSSGRDNRRFNNDRNSGRPSMHRAICSDCGQECEVPFRPTGDKPVYCSNCFDKGGNASSKGPDQVKQQLEALNNKLDKILKILAPVALQESAPKPESKKSKVNKTLAKVAPKKIKAKKKKK